MELRRFALCLALFVVAICSQSCSDAHAMHKRGLDDIYDEDPVMGDEATDDEAQNDGEGDADEPIVVVEMVSKPISYNVSEGGTVQLECKVKPEENAVLQWRKDSELLFMGRNVVKNTNKRITLAGESSNDLLISNAKLSDGGKYTCEVLQAEPATVVHELVVFSPPKILNFTASDNGVLAEGNNLLLTCKVSGSPPPQIVWSHQDKNGMNVRLQEGDATFTLNTAFIKDIKHNKGGKYFCYAFNSQGQAQSEVTVKVLHKPRVHLHKTVVNSAIGVEAKFQCYAYGEPLPRITWFKDGHLIESPSRYEITTDGAHSNLTVTPSDDSDFGTFSCEARNSHGKHSKSVELVEVPVVEGVLLDGNKLSWTVHSHQPLEQAELQLRDKEGTTTVLSVPVPETTGHEYNLAHLMDDVDQGTYEVVVKAKNQKGWSPASEPIVVDYEAPLPIQTASVYHGNSHSIRPAASLLLSTLFMYLLVRLF